MANFKVKWELDVDADTAEEAARMADRWLSEGSPEGWVFTVVSSDGSKEDFDSASWGIEEHE